MEQGQLSAVWQWMQQQGGDVMELGGPVMWPLLLVSVWLWTLVIERYWFIWQRLPLLVVSQQRTLADDPHSAPLVRTETGLAIRRYLNLIKTLSGIC